MNVVTGPDNHHEERLGQMIERYGKDLLRLCCVYLKDASLAEDAVQETFLKAYRHLDTFRGESGEKTWLVSIAVNVCRDMRKSAWFRYIDRSVDVDHLHLEAESPELPGFPLMEEIMRLPRREMEAVLLYYYADMLQSEIARMLNISEAAVSKRLARARRMLKDVLEGGAVHE